MGDYEEWTDYNFMWTQWKSNKIIEGLKTWKEFQNTNNNNDMTLSTFANTDKESASSTENLMTPKRVIPVKPILSSQSKEKPQHHKPFSSGIAPSRRVDSKKLESTTHDEENITSHHLRTTNHQENNFHLSNKKAIYYNMKVYYEATQQSTFDYLPLTYHIKDGLSDLQFAKFEDVYNNPDKN